MIENSLISTRMKDLSEKGGQPAIQAHWLNVQLEKDENAKLRELVDHAFLKSICRAVSSIEVPRHIVDRDFGHCMFRYLPAAMTEYAANFSDSSKESPKIKLAYNLAMKKLAGELALQTIKKMVVVSSGDSSWDVLVWKNPDEDTTPKKISRNDTADGTIAHKKDDPKLERKNSHSTPDLKPYEHAISIDGLMITFFKENLGMPALRPVKFKLTPYPTPEKKDKVKVRSQKSEIFSKTLLSARLHAGAVPSRIYNGDSHYHSWGNLVNVQLANFGNKADSKTSEKSCLEVLLPRFNLKDGYEFVSAGGLQSIENRKHLFEVVFRVLADRHKQLVVMRSITPHHIMVHKEYDANGMDRYGFFVKRSDKHWILGDEIHPPKNPFKNILTISPENLLKLNIDGSMPGYAPSPAEDLWAAGVVLAPFVLKWEQLTFFDHLEAIQQAGENKNEQLFEESKKLFFVSLQQFLNENEKSGQEDPFLYLILNLLQFNPEERITSEQCVKKLKLTAEIYAPQSEMRSLHTSSSS